MPKLTEVTEAARTAQALNAMALMIQDPTTKTKDAAEAAGLSAFQFRDWIRKHPKTIEAIREFVTLMQKDLLFDLVQAERGIVMMMIDDATNPLTSGRDRVTIHKWLYEYGGVLQKSLHAIPGVEESAHSFLKEGPMTESKKSRLASIEVSRTEDGVTVEVFEDQDDIIDITPEPTPNLDNLLEASPEIEE